MDTIEVGNDPVSFVQDFARQSGGNGDALAAVREVKAAFAKHVATLGKSQKAQETLDVIVGEFKRLSDGVSQDEIARAKVGLKSSLIMQSESSSARAGGIGMDHYFLGRVRPLDEIKAKIDETSVESVLAFLRSHRFNEFTVVTIGPKELKLNM